jgi:hypothetical protein
MFFRCRKQRLDLNLTVFLRKNQDQEGLVAFDRVVTAVSVFLDHPKNMNIRGMRA